MNSEARLVARLMKGGLAVKWCAESKRDMETLQKTMLVEKRAHVLRPSKE